MSETGFTRAGEDDLVSRVQIDLDGNVAACFRKPAPSFLVELSELDDELKAHGKAFFAGMAKLALAEQGADADEVKIADEVLANSVARVEAKVEPVEPEEIK